MSLKLVHLAAEIENCDDFHIARLILLLNAAGKRSNKPVEGIMKLAKMDFLLRYPNCLVRALKAVDKEAIAQEIPTEEQNTIETRMIRFRFGPWDKRYRRWIGLLMSKGLVDTYLKGRTVNVKLTPAGIEVAAQLSELEEFSPIAKRSKIVVSAVGDYPATKLKDFVYEVFPEIVDMQWGRYIDI
ncbi:hypothetical protein [Methanosarcina soligelidi]|uniref:hypothetical protein n=1 Tax=Methanosarcina soligelidi TaxID=1036677 RepID=UPI00064EA8A2|nr:hypothetical protein [Methanosarcina soligelidi]